MIDPYSDEPGGNGELMFGHNQIKELFTAFDAARFQIHVHVIGDGAVRAALDALEAARQANGPWPSLHQLAHVQCIDPADIPRFRELGVVANIQTLWARYEPSSRCGLPWWVRNAKMDVRLPLAHRCGRSLRHLQRLGRFDLNPFRSWKRQSPAAAAKAGRPSGLPPRTVHEP